MKAHPPLFAIILILAFPRTPFSQSFLPAYKPGGGYLKAIVIKQNGDSIRGKVTWMFTAENIKQLTVKDDQDVKHKFEEEDIKQVLVEFSKMDKIATSMQATSLKDMSQTSFDQVFNTDYFIWEPAVTPKKGKLKVLQLVNPGFDSKMKIYRNPTSQETGGMGIGGMKLTGGIEKSYFLVRPGSDIAIELTKGDYKKQFFDVFVKACPEMEKVLNGNKPDWDDLPKHVFYYFQNCN